MTIKISGRTFDEREKIKSLGGLWDGVNRVWTLPDFTPEHRLNELRNTPGISIIMPDGNVLMPGKVERPEPKIKPRRDPEPINWGEVFGGFGNNKFADGTGTTNFHGNDETWLGEFAANKPTAFFGFDSFSAMVDYVERIPSEISGERNNGRNVGWKPDQGSWVGSPSMPAAINIARNGWREGVELARTVADMIEAEHAQSRRRKHSLAGGKVNVGRMLAGSPDHMVHRPRQDGRKIVTLFVDVWMSAGISSQSAIIRAACVAAMADLLESHGYSCEIVAVGSAYDSGKRCQVATVVKRAGDMMNIEDTVFALGHPSMLRRLCFALAATENRLRSFWSGMGMQEAAISNPGPNQFYINKLSDSLNGDLTDKVRKAFDLILPDKFPIDLRD